MMFVKEPLAHSARPKELIPAQTYREHIQQTIEYAKYFFDGMAVFCINKDLMEQVRVSLLQAVEKHDLGKLLEENQSVLSSTSGERKPLPIPHEEAGFWCFFQQGMYESAILVACHHSGLKNISGNQQDWENSYLRSSDELRKMNLNQLASLLEQHNKLFPAIPDSNSRPSLSPLGFRFMLSCLVDADHLDTAKHYDNEIEEPDIRLHASERFEKLSTYVKQLQSKGDDSERNQLRKQFFDECAEVKDHQSSFFFTDAPVGLGKTTSLMASALRLAGQTGARRIIVVLPLSTLIAQSSERYQDALQLESKQEFVAENHHRADFSHPYSRALSERWTHPVVVTSHVQFFETLASNKTGRLRKLHQVPGSIVVIDEAHMTLPMHLWPLAWQWMNELQNSWGCRFLFASGTMGKFWELDEFKSFLEKQPKWIRRKMDVEFLNSEAIADEWHQKEEARVQLSPLGADVDNNAPWTLDELLAQVADAEGPRLVVLNTVATAAIVAEHFRTSRKFKNGVYHLSTALTFLDRQKVLNKVKSRLKKKETKDWVMVATSIAETGLDVSFRNGFREFMSFASMLQFKGRINRENEFVDSSIVMFSLSSGSHPLIKQHKSVGAMARVLKSMLRGGMTSPKYSTEALRRELQEQKIGTTAKELLESESRYKFDDVGEKFKVIESDTRLILVDEDKFERLENGFMNVAERKVLFRDKAIQMYATKIKDMKLTESSRYPGVFLWSYGYDDFLGYMRGVLDSHELQEQNYVF